MSTRFDPRHGCQISHYLHCHQCVEERPYGISQRDWCALEIGFTALGFQVWCRRHEINVFHVDFQDQKHPADTACPKLGSREYSGDMATMALAVATVSAIRSASHTDGIRSRDEWMAMCVRAWETISEIEHTKKITTASRGQS